MNEQKKRANIFNQTNKSDISSGIGQTAHGNRNLYEEEKVKGDLIQNENKANLSSQRGNLFNDKSKSRERIPTKASDQSTTQNRISQMVSPGRGDQTLKEFPFLFLASKKYETQEEPMILSNTKDFIEEGSSLNIAQINQKHGVSKKEEPNVTGFNISERSLQFGNIAHIPQDFGDETFDMQEQFLKEINDLEMLSSSDVSDGENPLDQIASSDSKKEEGSKKIQGKPNSGISKKQEPLRSKGNQLQVIPEGTFEYNSSVKNGKGKKLPQTKQSGPARVGQPKGRKDSDLLNQSVTSQQSIKSTSSKTKKAPINNIERQTVKPINKPAPNPKEKNSTFPLQKQTTEKSRQPQLKTQAVEEKQLQVLSQSSPFNEHFTTISFSTRNMDEEESKGGSGQGQKEHMVEYNRKEERIKSKIGNDIMDELLYKIVLPSEIKEILEIATMSPPDSEVIKSMNQQEKLIIESIIEDTLLKQVLIKFLKDFFNLSILPELTDRAIKSYIKEHLIEKVNFSLCSEIWNDFLLLPTIMKEDPMLCVDNMIRRMIEDEAKETLKEERGVVQYELRLPPTPCMGEMTKGYEVSFQAEDLESQYQAQDAAIWKFIEDELILGVIYDNVEDMAIIQVQEQYFLQKNLSKFISEEIYHDLFKGEVRKLASDCSKAEKFLEKGSQNHLDIFLKMELQALAEELINQEKLAPFEAADFCVGKLQNQMVSGLMEWSAVSLSYEISQKQQLSSLIDTTLKEVLKNLSQEALNSKNHEESIFQKIFEDLEMKAISTMIAAETAQSLKEEKETKKCAAHIGDGLLKAVVSEVCNQEVEGEIIEQQANAILRNLLQGDIWNESLKDLENEKDACREIVDEAIDEKTKEFFFEHFNEIKEECLGLYRQELLAQNSRNNLDPLKESTVYETEDFMQDVDEGKTPVGIAPVYREPRMSTMGFLNVHHLDRLRGDLGSLFTYEAKEDQMLPIDAQAIDVLCVNCYECIKVDAVDSHSIQCVQQSQESRLKKARKEERKKREYSLPQISGNDQNVMVTKGYNFDEGMYEEEEEEKVLEGEEEREMINEINERIFKLHKALKQKQVEMQVNTNGDDLRYLRHLDEFEQLALNIFTNNTNKKELEFVAQELIEKLQEFKPQNGNELGLNITVRRLAQLVLQKIELMDSYLRYLENKADYFDDDEEDSANFYLENPGFFNGTPIKDFGKPQFSPNCRNNHLDDYESGYPKSFEEHLKRLEEESQQQKAELEMWRNLHNEMLKNYLDNKAQNNKFINDINSDVSGTSGKQSEGLSSHVSSQTSNLVQNNMPSPQKYNDDVAQLDEVEESLKYKQNEDLKRYFYTIAIHNSKKILKSVPQGQLLKQLHQKCLVKIISLIIQSAKVPVNEWDGFIQSELKKIAK